VEESETGKLGLKIGDCFPSKLSILARNEGSGLKKKKKPFKRGREESERPSGREKAGV